MTKTFKTTLAAGLAGAAAVCISGCTTTGSSSASTFGGWRSNFTETHTLFQGRFEDTIDKAAAAQDQSTLSNEEMRELALRDDPQSRRGFYGLVHASLFNMDPKYRHLVNDAATEAYLRGLLDEVLSGWEGERPEVGVVVSADPTMRGLSFENNFIVVPIGVLINAESDDEVAGLLGHEAAHLLLGHHQAADARTQERKLNEALDMVGMFGAAARTARFRETPGGGFEMYSANDEDAAEMLVAVNLGTQFSREMARTFLFPSLNREQEDHADLLGADLLSDAGYNPAQMTELLARTASQLETDTQAVARLGEAEKMQVAVAAEQLGVDTSSLLGQVGLTVAITGYEQLRGRARNPYRSMEARRGMMADYVAREYPESLGQSVSTAGLDRLKRETNVLQAYERAFEGAIKRQEAGMLYAEAAQAERARTQAAQAAARPASSGNLLSDLITSATAQQAVEDAQALPDPAALRAQAEEARAESVALLAEAVRIGGGDQSYIRFAYYEALRDAGRPNEAFRQLEIAADMPSASAEVFEHYARALLDRRRADDADAMLDRGEQITGTALPYLPMRMEADLIRGETDAAMAHYLECAEVSNENTRDRCTTLAQAAGLIEEEEGMDFNIFSGMGS